MATHGESVVIAERLVGPKSTEVPEFAPLLRGLAARTAGVAGACSPWDAGHTVRAHAEFITQELFAHYVMIVKENTTGLYRRIDALDWAEVPITHQVEETGHGRRERRTLRVLDAPADLGFPGAAQVFLIARYTTRSSVNESRAAASTRPCRSTSRSPSSGSAPLSSREAAAEHLAGYVRGHGAIENKIH